LIGRISPWKGQHVFLRAAARVLKRFPEARFVIAGAAIFGEEAYEKQLHRLVRELAIADQVDFLGFSTDVPSVIEGLDVVAHASTLPEPFGQVIIEAMASAKPVVATLGGGVTEIIDDNITGLLVPMGDDQEMGYRGRIRVLRQFTIDKTVRQVQEVYDFLLDTRDGRLPSAHGDSRKFDKLKQVRSAGRFPEVKADWKVAV
jgi:glycosyltransferase involved in cell wall biosynthesis